MQDYPGLVECLVVFDQSTPVPPSVVVGKNRELRVLENKRTLGLAGARNTGALAANGELLAFCDDNDESLPEKLRLQTKLLAKERDAVVVGCGSYLCHGDRRFLRIPRQSEVSYRDLLRSRHTELNSSSVLLGTKTFVHIGLADENIPGAYAEDYDWLLRAARTTRILNVRQPLTVIYIHDRSYFSRDWSTVISALIYLLRKHPEFRTESGGLSRIYGQIAFAHAALGNRREARTWLARSLRLNPLEPRWCLSWITSHRFVKAETVTRLTMFFGKGII